jgi:hypothetical protein
MSSYRAVSITYSTTSNRFTKTTAGGTAEYLYQVITTPIYTVPAGCVAKIQYLTASCTGAAWLSNGTVTGNTTYAVTMKINNYSDDNGGRFMEAINAVSVTVPMNIYLGAGDDLYLRHGITFASAAPIDQYGYIYPSVYISIIEEY